jgi:hypothetical protein
MQARSLAAAGVDVEVGAEQGTLKFRWREFHGDDGEALARLRRQNKPRKLARIPGNKSAERSLRRA